MLAYSQLEEQHREKSKNLIKRQLQAGRERVRGGEGGKGREREGGRERERERKREERRERERERLYLISVLVDPSQKPSDEKVEELLESQDLSVFTQDVRQFLYNSL